ncbi:MAG: NADH-quinone oxidoreductase subunit C [Deltaproteobacteria bacterium]|nr:NADH-quinone oxidoreductase subunit C [Deltaproteobacteria bacterium]
MGLSVAEIFDHINRFANQEVILKEEGPDPSISITAYEFSSVMRYLKEVREMDFDTLMSQTAVHIDDTLVMYWHLFSYSHRHKVVIECALPFDDLSIDSVTTLWKSADWLERETFDLFGVDFKGHPDLRRLLLPEDWVGYPLRKDYQTPMLYGGMDNTPSEISQSFKPPKKER